MSPGYFIAFPQPVSFFQHTAFLLVYGAWREGPLLMTSELLRCRCATSVHSSGRSCCYVLQQRCEVWLDSAAAFRHRPLAAAAATLPWSEVWLNSSAAFRYSQQRCGKGLCCAALYCAVVASAVLQTRGLGRARGGHFETNYWNHHSRVRVGYVCVCED